VRVYATILNFAVTPPLRGAGQRASGRRGVPRAERPDAGPRPTAPPAPAPRCLHAAGAPWAPAAAGRGDPRVVPGSGSGCRYAAVPARIPGQARETHGIRHAAGGRGVESLYGDPGTREETFEIISLIAVLITDSTPPRGDRPGAPAIRISPRWGLQERT